MTDKLSKCPNCGFRFANEEIPASDTIQRLDKLEHNYVMLEARFHMLERAYKYLESLLMAPSEPKEPTNKPSEPVCIPSTDRFFRQEP